MLALGGLCHMLYSAFCVYYISEHLMGESGLLLAVILLNNFLVVVTISAVLGTFVVQQWPAALRMYSDIVN